MKNSYFAICGSRAYQLDTNLSDWDYVYADYKRDIPQIERPEHSHIIYHNMDAFIDKILLIEDRVNSTNAIFLQGFYPYKFIFENDFSNYIKNNREEIIKNNISSVFKNYLNTANAVLYNNLKLGDKNRKSICRACLYYQTLIDYASQNISFEEAFYPKDDFKSKVLNIKTGETPLIEAKLFLKDLRDECYIYEDFYKNKNNPEYLRQVKIDLKNIVKE